MKFTNYKAVAFDLDGVLVNSEGVNLESARVAFQHFNYELSKEELNHIAGKHPRDYVDQIIRNNSKLKLVAEDIREEQHKAYYAILDGAMPLSPGVRDSFEYLAQRNVPLALVTSGWSMVPAFIEQHDLGTVFSVVVMGNDVVHRKPHPDPYLLAVEKLQVMSSDVIAIEDTETGLASAKAAGCRCIAVPNSYTKHQDFSQADLVIDSLTELPSIL